MMICAQNILYASTHKLTKKIVPCCIDIHKLRVCKYIILSQIILNKF